MNFYYDKRCAEAGGAFGEVGRSARVELTTVAEGESVLCLAESADGDRCGDKWKSSWINRCVIFIAWV